MIPPFADHPLIREFNEIKRYFRSHETKESRSRLLQFRNYTRRISESGFDVAFDFVGSINFGQAISASDVDIVMYLRCPGPCGERCPGICNSHQGAQAELVSTLKNESTASNTRVYDVQVIDTINLTDLERALEEGDADSYVLLRFAFYRSICRPVNVKILRPYQKRLVEDQKLIETMRPRLRDLFDGLCATSKHHLSFNKYQERLAQMGIQIPGIMRAIIRRYQEDNSLLPDDPQ
ncbi:MAG: hypothetical protein NXI24_04350 [bacterium]|nr:hypothetical protein [bacterium]